MSEFFSQDGDADDFALPGDDALAARLGISEPDADPAPEPVAEEAPVVEAEAVEPDATDERKRNPDGTFAKEEDEGEAEPPLILGKFKTTEDLAKSTEELERHYSDLQKELGSLRNELGEARREAQEVAARPSAPSSWDDLIDENPAQAAKLAYERGETMQLQKAAAAWEQMSPGAPELWAETVRMRAEMNERFAQYDQTLAPVQAQAANGQLTEGVAALREKYPDLTEFVQTPEFAELAKQIPLAKKALTEGTPTEVVSAVETVYLIHRGRASDNLKDTARDVARTAAEEAQAMREEAFVASATATTATPRVSKADEYATGWDDVDKLFDSGWNV